MRYATANNFTGQPLPGYDAGACIPLRAAALALKRVQADRANENLSLKVYDCYRPTARGRRDGTLGRRSARDAGHAALLSRACRRTACSRSVTSRRTRRIRAASPST